jgi:hypothetical protein
MSLRLVKGTIVLVLVIALLLPGASVAPAAPSRANEETQISSVSSRASDAEPANNDLSGATTFAKGELVHGSIMVTAPDDYLDWYRYSAPSASVVNVTLYQYEYNPNNRSEYNLQLVIGYFYEGRLLWADIAATENQWEMVTALAYSATEFYIVVVVNTTADGSKPNTRPVNYSLGLGEKAPTSIVRDVAQWDNLDLEGGYKSASWYVLTPPPAPDEWLEAVVGVPWSGDYDVLVYNGWPFDKGRLQPINISKQRGTGNVEYLTFSGAEGPFYIKVVSRMGNGWFSIQLKTLGDTRDLNNKRDNGKEVTDTEPIRGSLDQGVDHYDWFKVKMRKGEVIPKIRFEIDQGPWGVYNLSVFDESNNYVAGAYNTATGGFPTDVNPTIIGMNIRDVTAAYDGYYYAVLRAMTGSAGMGDPNYFDPVSCEYYLTFTLPNDPPKVKADLPSIVIDEDTTYTGLNLSNYFKDPDGDKLKFSLGQPTDHLKVNFNEVTWAVTITPDLDWHGKETVVIRATDSGPGHKYVESSMSVTVKPVNDPPALIPNRAIGSLVLYENETAQTTGMATVFMDPDNDPGRPLIYNISLVRESVTPPGALIPMLVYNRTTDAFVVGPIDYLFGNATFKVQADDGNGTPAAQLPSTTFNVTIIHRNHPPTLKAGVKEPVSIKIEEGEYDDTYSVWDFVEDRDTGYAGDTLTFVVSGQVTLGVAIASDGRIQLDARKEYYPGQNYQEEILIKVTDRFGASLTLNLSVTIVPIDDPPELVSASPVTGTSVQVPEGSREEFMVIVRDPDTPHSAFNYSWYFDGAQITGENKSLYAYTTGYDSADGKVHVLKVVVRSGAHVLEASWNVTVINVNRPPINVQVLEPLNASRYKKGDTVKFLAEAVDPDGDQLTYHWYESRGLIGSGRQFEKKDLGPGIHIITLAVSDGKSTVNSTVVFEVARPAKSQGAVPGFGALALVLAVVAAAAVLGHRRLRQGRWSP